MTVRSQLGIRERLTRWFFFASVLPLLIVASVIYVLKVADTKETATLKLSVIRDLKVKEIESWITARKGDVLKLSEIPDLRSLELLRTKKAPLANDTHYLAHVRKTLQISRDFNRIYSEIFLLDPSGRVVISTNEGNEGLDKRSMPYFRKTAAGRGVVIGNVHFSAIGKYKEQRMIFSAPVSCSLHAGEHLLGSLVLRIDLKYSLSPLLLDRSGLGDSGETFIVNGDGVALSDLRWSQDAPQKKLQIKSKSAARAGAGETGVVEDIDYRDVPVFAAFVNIPDTSWGFIAKQDKAEIYKKVNMLLRNLVIVLLFLIPGLYVLALYISRSVSKPVLEVTEAAKRVRDGFLEVRVAEQEEVEFRILAEVFNSMAKSLSSARKIEADVLELSEMLVAEKDMKLLGERVLRKLVDCSGSAFGAFYRINKESREFELFFSLGFDREELGKIEPEIINGAFNAACESQKMVYIDQIPKETVFVVNTVAGRAIPKSMLTIPVIIEGKTGAVISLGSLNTYSEETREFFKRVYLTMNAGISNMVSGEEIQRLVTILDLKNVELEGQATELIATSEELQQQNRELIVQRKEVEEANKLKSEFMSNMSHELRTPLNSVLALSGVLQMQCREKLDSEEMGYLEIIERNGRQLLNLINDILDLAKIEAGRMDIEEEFFQPRITIENIVETIEPLCREKGISLEVKIPDDIPGIKSDERKLFHIVQNLLSNAVKFTDEGTIAVTAWFEGDKIFLTVSDTGIGIKEEEISKIFREFQQVDGSVARRYEGTGLGLAIARKAARLLGGDLDVSSRYGRGSTFTLRLPAEGGVTKFDLESHESTPEERPAAVLLIDDDPVFLKIMYGHLSEEGFDVLTASSGRAALELAGRYRPMAIVLDIFMPDLDGWEVLGKLKANSDTSRIPVIICSITKERETGFALGAVGHLMKPVKKNEIVSEIRRLCFAPLSVMVVDDSELDRNNVMKAIESENIHVVGASSGSECVRLVRDAKPDLLILDLMMPDMDGFALLNKLRSEPATSELPVIVLTAKDLNGEEKERLHLHFVTFMEKNQMTFDRLLGDVKKHLCRVGGRIPPLSHRGASKSKIILVVEDNESSVVQIKGILAREGYQVDVARGGREAVQYVGRTVPDAIVMDLMMPDMDGFQVLDEIRGAETTKYIPVLVLTAKTLTSDDLNRLKENNIFQLVQKGDVKREELVRKIRNMFLDEKEHHDHLLRERSTGNVLLKNERPGKQIRVPIKPGEKPTILVIEDNPDNMQTLRAILKTDYSILEASDGEEGLKRASQDLPSLILLDISLPGMDGFQVIRKLKDCEKTSKIPVLAVTAHVMSGDREKILSAGFDDIIGKPIILEKMVEKLNDIFIG